MASSKKKLFALRDKKKYSFNLPLEETITISGREYLIQVKEDEKHGTYILWKNRRYPVDILQSKQNKYEIFFNDISYSFTIETPFSLKRKKVLNKVRGKSDKEKLIAPMPGKIIDVMVREGAEISRGEPIYILEAMKMQNEINSPVDGTVTAVNIKPNTNVIKNDVLIEIKIK